MKRLKNVTAGTSQGDFHDRADGLLGLQHQVVGGYEAAKLQVNYVDFCVQRFTNWHKAKDSIKCLKI